MNGTTLERIERQIEGWPNGAVKSGWERMIEEARRQQQEDETRQRKEGRRGQKESWRAPVTGRVVDDGLR
jgi:hypothetical protein